MCILFNCHVIYKYHSFNNYIYILIMMADGYGIDYQQVHFFDNISY